MKAVLEPWVRATWRKSADLFVEKGRFSARKIAIAAFFFAVS